MDEAHKHSHRHLKFVFFPEESVKHSSYVLISRQHLTPLPVFSPSRLELHILTRVPHTAEMCKEVGNTCTQLYLVPMHLSGCVSKKRTSHPQPVGLCAFWSWNPASRVGAVRSLPVRSWRKTPPRALIATMRDSPEALLKGGLVLQAGNLLLFIDQ